MSRQALSAIAGAALAIALLAAPAQGSDERSAPGPARFAFAPGKIGDARADMTVRRAVRTGLFRTDVPYPCGVHPLEFKKKRSGQLFVDVKRGRIDRMYALRGQYRTTRGVGLGSTLAEVRAAYPTHNTGIRSSAEDGAADFYVWRGRKGPDRRWLSFGFWETADEVQPSSRVRSMFVSVGAKPWTYADGC